MQHQRIKVINMLSRNVIVNSHLVAKPVAEILFNNKTVDTYNLYEVDDYQNSERFVCKLILRAGSTRQAVKENAVNKFEALIDYDE
jgi:hypothetical protein